MNARERLITALTGGCPDKVPSWELIIDQPVVEELLKEEAIGLDELSAYILLTEKLDLEGVTAFEVMRYKELNSKTVQDEWGITYRLGGNGEKFPIDGPIKTKQDLKNYSPPDPHADYRWDSLKRMVDGFKDRRAIAVCVHDAFEYPWFLRGGMDKYLQDYYRNPGFIKALSEIVVDYNVELVKDAVKLGADFVVSGDDYAFKKGPIMSPGHFEEFILPGLAKIVEATHGGGALFLKHTDGQVWPLLDMIVDTGIDGLCPIEPAAGMDIGEVKGKYGGRIAVVGNIDCARLLSQGTKEEVREAVRECLNKASPGGGHILSSSNSIHRGVKPENYITMIQALREFGEYPISL